MQPRRTLTLALGAPLLAAALGAAPPANAQDCLTAAGGGTVEGHDGFASLVMADAREVRLADIVPASAAAPADESNALVPFLGAQVSVLSVTDLPDDGDRYGRTLGDVALKDTGERLSPRLLREGLALVDPAVMSGSCLDALFAAEREAEKARRGIWAHGALVRFADDPELAKAAGKYAIVQGELASVGQTRRTIYLNFGADYRTDFTALVRREDAEGWADTLTALKGRTVRIRGVVQAWNGGLIRVEHLRQIELLPEGRP